jgi:hypothetical protein
MKIARLCISILICTALVSAVALMQEGTPEATEQASQLSAVPYVYDLTCGDSAQRIVGEVGTTATVSCPSDCAAGSVWGTDVYTSDSSVCTAARHAGVITSAGGTFTVHILAGQSSYEGSEQNSVTTSDFSEFGLSYEVVPEEDAVVQATCDLRAYTVPGDPGTKWRVACPADCTAGTIWGTGTYTDDSNVCASAVHAGVIGADGGEFSLLIAPGQPRYEATMQNDMSSIEYGEWPRSFTLAPAPPPAILLDGTTSAGSLSGEPGSIFLVKCPADFALGIVWGTGTYTDDSSVCTAALHSGVIGMEGGRFTVIISPGQEMYKASTANGVTTLEYGGWERSFLVADATQGEAAFYEARAAMNAEETETP